MAITFASARYFSTANTTHMFCNVPVASQSFKVRVDSADPVHIPGTVNVVSRNIFDFVHSFWGSPTSTANLNLQLNGANGSVQANIPLTIGTVYVICLVWDGTAGVQTCYVNGVPQVMGHIAGLTSNRIDPIQIGPFAVESAIVYTLGDYNAWDNYGLTLADAAALTNNVDPTTVGTGASWRCRWTLDGPTGATAAIGDAGLKNAYGTGADFASVAGAGTANYATPLVWAPTVTAHPYVAGCGKIIAATMTLNYDGSLVAPSQLLTTPTITVNGTDLGALTNPWFTGVHQCVLWSTPGSVVINPGDVVTLTAPPAWCNTPSGSVGPLSGTIDNRSGKSSVQVEGLTKTLRMGINNSANGGLEYYPFKNAKFLVGLSGEWGKLRPGHGYQVVNQPCESGLALLVWDATKPSTPAQLSLVSGAPSLVTVTHLPQYDVSPSNGIGYVRVYDIEYVPNSAYQTTVGGSTVALNYDDPAYTGVSNYDDLWIYLPGEWSLVNGVPVFDRSDPFALSNIYLDRVTQNVGSMRAVDMTPCGAADASYPYPELLAPSTVEWFWGYQYRWMPKVGFTSLGPVDVTATPWFYSAQFRQPGNLFSATLSQAINTAPAVGTNETYTFADAATAPLMAGLEIQLDAEIMRIISVSGTSVTLYRGSNGTTPATHSAGTVTVFGRQPITMKVSADGTAPYTAPVLIRCDKPHGITSLHGYWPQVALNITMADGTVANPFYLGTVYVTGPDTFVSIWSGYYPDKPQGTKPSQIYALNPAANFFQNGYQVGIPIDVYAQMVGKFPYANLHVNIPMDACDDMAYKFAWTMRDNFPAGRKVYVEYANEPWNWAPPFAANLYCTNMAGIAMPAALNTYGLAYYAYRATRVHQIFREVFTAAGRGSEIVGIVNCQMGSGQLQVTPHLNLALSLGQPLDAIACAPYFSMSAYPASIAAFNLYDDDQAAEMLLHDITYDPTGNIVAWIKNIAAAIKVYNQQSGKNCILMGYEGGIEYAAPAGAAHHDERSHDIQYNPNFYNVEQGWFKILQDNGFDHLHVYALGIGWPASWGMYHMRTQKHSLGDGRNGASNNRQICINPTNPGYIGGSTLQQDLLADSVRGQAFVDWLGAIGQSTPPPAATAYTVTAPTPASGLINTASGNFTVQPNGPYTGTITVTPSGGGLSTPMVLTWANSSAPQTFAITPTVIGTVTLTLTNSGSLTDIGSLTYQCTAAPPPSSNAPWWGAWLGRWLAASRSGGSGTSNTTSSAGGVVQGGATAVSFLDVHAPRSRHRFVPWSRRRYGTRGR